MPDEKDVNAPDDFVTIPPAPEELLEKEAEMSNAETGEAPPSVPFLRGIGGVNRLLRKNPISPYEQLIEKRAHLQEELVRTEEAIKALEANPEIERVMRLVGRALY